MPSGRVPVRTMICRHCRAPFDTDRIGRQAWYCHRPACDESLAAARRKAERDRKRAQAWMRLDVRPGPLRDQIQPTLRSAAIMPPHDARLKAAVAAYRLGPSSHTARQIAAAALAIAADLSVTEQQIGAAA